MADGVREPRGPLWELTLFRIKDAVRDPMALFWTFVFPIFVAVGLGLAFRSEAPAPERVVMACGAAAEECRAVAERLAAEPRVAVSEAPLPSSLDDL